MQRLAAEEGGDEEAVGAERAAGLDELADGVVRPVQREGVQDEVVRALLRARGSRRRDACARGRGRRRPASRPRASARGPTTAGAVNVRLTSLSLSVISSATAACRKSAPPMRAARARRRARRSGSKRAGGLGVLHGAGVSFARQHRIDLGQCHAAGADDHAGQHDLPAAVPRLHRADRPAARALPGLLARHAFHRRTVCRSCGVPLVGEAGAEDVCESCPRAPAGLGPRARRR